MNILLGLAGLFGMLSVLILFWFVCSLGVKHGEKRGRERGRRGPMG